MKSMRSVVSAGVLATIFVLSMSSAVDAGDREPSRKEAFKKIMSGLEQGIHALKALGMEEEAARLTRIAKGVHQRFVGGQKERQAAEHQVEVLRLAMKALLEADKHDAAHRLETKIHAIELSLEGRRDAEANQVRESAPKKGEVAELLQVASRLWAEFGHEGKAETVAKMAREFAGMEARGRKAGGEERRKIERHIEILRFAMTALREAEKKDLVGVIERKVHALRMDLDGRKDRESMGIRERAPGTGDMAEILSLSAELWKKFGDHDKAEACAELGEHYRHRYHQERESEREEHYGHVHREGRDRDEGREHHEGDERRETAERIEGLERQITEMMEMMDRLHDQLEKLKRDTR